MADKLALTGEIDPRVRLNQIIDEYFSRGGMEQDLEMLPAEKRLQIMAKYAEFRWGKKTAESEDAQEELNTTSDLINAVYEKMAETKDR